MRPDGLGNTSEEKVRPRGGDGVPWPHGPPVAGAATPASLGRPRGEPATFSRSRRSPKSKRRVTGGRTDKLGPQAVHPGEKRSFGPVRAGSTGQRSIRPRKVCVWTLRPPCRLGGHRPAGAQPPPRGSGPSGLLLPPRPGARGPFTGTAVGAGGLSGGRSHARGPAHPVLPGLQQDARCLTLPLATARGDTR